jgi:hypothetical protein
VSNASWRSFQRTVLSDERLQLELRAIRAWPEFVAAVLRVAAERGLALSADDLEAAAREGRSAWMERHL